MNKKEILFDFLINIITLKKLLESGSENIIHEYKKYIQRVYKKEYDNFIVEEDSDYAHYEIILDIESESNSALSVLLEEKMKEISRELDLDIRRLI